MNEVGRKGGNSKQALNSPLRGMQDRQIKILDSFEICSNATPQDGIEKGLSIALLMG